LFEMLSAMGQNMSTLELADGTHLTLILKNEQADKNTYYLPVNFRTAEKDGTPQSSLMYYTNEEAEEAILHLMITWGLTEQQQNNAEEMLSKTNHEPAFIMGAINLSSAEEFTISQNTKLGKLLNRSLTSLSKPPLMPGAKMALSFKINSNDTKQLKILLEDETQLQQTYFNFCYHDATNATSYKKLNYIIPFIKFFNSKS